MTSVIKHYLGELQIVNLLLGLRIIDHLGQHQHEHKREHHHQNHWAEEEVSDLKAGKDNKYYSIID